MGPGCAQAALSRRLSAAAADKTKEETQQQPTAVPLTRTTFHCDTPLPTYHDSCRSACHHCRARIITLFFEHRRM